MTTVLGCGNPRAVSVTMTTGACDTNAPSVSEPALSEVEGFASLYRR